MFIIKVDVKILHFRKLFDLLIILIVFFLHLKIFINFSFSKLLPHDYPIFKFQRISPIKIAKLTLMHCNYNTVMLQTINRRLSFWLVFIWNKELIKAKTVIILMNAQFDSFFLLLLFVNAIGIVKCTSETSIICFASIHHVNVCEHFCFTSNFLWDVYHTLKFTFLCQVNEVR